MGDDRRSEETGELELTTADLAERARSAEAPPPSDGIIARGAEERSDERTDAREDEDRASPLFPGDEAETLRRRWTEIQAGFVDEPRRSVEEADRLVADAIRRLAETFADERERLESQWGQGERVDTEDLRQALRRYRSFFDRLLSV